MPPAVADAGDRLNDDYSRQKLAASSRRIPLHGMRRPTTRRAHAVGLIRTEDYRFHSAVFYLQRPSLLPVVIAFSDNFYVLLSEVPDFLSAGYMNVSVRKVAGGKEPAVNVVY